MNDEKEIMTKAVKELAPCGLDCARCVSFKGGQVEQLSSPLLAALEGYEHIAKNTAKIYPILEHYQTFIDVLSHLKTHATCMGCRFTEEGGCGVRKCHKENHVDFCFQCSKYPCSPSVYNDHLLNIWRANNDQMQSEGIAAYYTSQKQKPRY